MKVVVSIHIIPCILGTAYSCVVLALFAWLSSLMQMMKEGYVWSQSSCDRLCLCPWHLMATLTALLVAQKRFRDANIGM